MRILITVEYNGKNFSGWQIQPSLRTVQGVLTDSLSSLLKQAVTLHGSGRTDAGVHALNQKAHFDYFGNFPIERLPFAINTILPNDVKVKNAEIVSDDFETQYNAKKKTYKYSFYLSRISRPLYDDFYAHLPYPMEKFNLSKAQRALSNIVGTHDFTAFSSTGRPVKSAIRTIYSAQITQNEEIVSLTITGNGFLYNMVRIIAGTIAEIGLGFLDETAIEKALSSLNRTDAGKTFPPQGLTLIDVTF